MFKHIYNMGLLNSIGQWLIRKSGAGYFYQPQSTRLGTKGAVWLDTNTPNDIYNEIAEYKLVVDRGAKLFSNAEVLLTDKEGQIIENESFKKLINKPNPMQAGNEFLEELYKQYRVYGNQFVYGNKPSAIAEWPVALWNVSPAYLQPVLTGKVFEQTTLDGIVQYFQYIENENKRIFETKDLIWMKITDLDNPVIGKSPVYALKFPLTNTKLAYQYRNVIMAERGAIGILRPRAERDSMGVLPMDADERKRIHNEYIKNYGVDDRQSRIILENVEWEPMSYPTKDLLLFEEIDANKMTIIDSEGLSVNIFATKSATYENVKHGMIQSYQDTIIPFADMVAQAWTERFCREGQKIKFSYEHVSILKQDKTQDITNLNTATSSLTQLVQSGILNTAQASAIITNMTNELGFTQ